MVSHRNVTHFIDAMVNRYDITSNDRFSQMFDATFDLSVLDIFVAWEKAACVCCPSEKSLLNPDAFIRDKALTVWTSVPTVGVFMKRLGVLKPNRYRVPALEPVLRRATARRRGNRVGRRLRPERRSRTFTGRQS